MTTEPTVHDSAKSDTFEAPKAQQTSTITLTAHGATLQLIAERKADSARTYVITTGADKKSSTTALREIRKAGV